MTHGCYSEYTDAPGWLGSVPRSWNHAPLWAVATCNDEVMAEDTNPEHIIQYVEISGVTAGQGITEVTDVAFGEAPSRARRKVRDGDVLVSTVRTYLRAIAPIKSPPVNMIASTGFAVLRARDIKAEYLSYAVQAEYFISEVIARSVGVSYPAINASDLMNISVPVPSPAEQTAIATFLDRETGKIDALVEEQRRLIDLLKEKRQAVISHAVTKGLDRSAKMRPSGIGWLGDVPQHWQMKRLKYLGEAIIGLTYSPADVVDEGAGLLVLRSSNVQGGKITLNDNVYVSSTPPERLLTREGDILICSRNGSRALIGKNAIIHGPSVGMTFGAFMTIFRSSLNNYLSWVFGSSLFETQSGAFMSSTINQLTTSTLNAMEVPVPPEEERTAIATYLAQAVGNLEVLIDQAHSSIKLLDERRAALISAAVTGKIDVQPASGRVSVPIDRARLRTTVAAEIVDLLSHKRSFGRVKLQKLLYLAETDAGIVELQGQYLREAAGPLDHTLIAEVDAGLQQDQHVTVVQSDGPGSQVVYQLRGQRGAYHDELVASIGDRAPALRALVQKLGDLDTKSIEAVTTVYAVWNDELLDHREPTDAMIVSGVLEDWHPEKARKFKAEELLTWLGWMRRNKLVPRGNGPRTITGRLFV